MNADLFTLLLTLGLISGPAVAAPPQAPATEWHSSKEPLPFELVVGSQVVQYGPVTRRVGDVQRLRVCFREEIEAGAPKECARFRSATKGPQFEMIVFANEPRRDH